MNILQAAVLISRIFWAKCAIVICSMWRNTSDDNGLILDRRMLVPLLRTSRKGGKKDKGKAKV